MSMKLIIAGSRTITDYDIVKNAFILFPYEVTEIISGGARGVDKIGEQIAKEFNIPFTIFNADWEQFGKSAGYIRNTQMAQYADALLSICK